MKIRMKFVKTGTLRFISHLDVMRYFQKANRRAGIDICYSGGFNPHQVLSFAAPLGLGLTSEGEYADLEVHSTLSSKDTIAALNAVMTEGMEVTGWVKVPKECKPAMAQTAASDYLVYFREGYEPEDCEEFIQEFQGFLKQESVVIEKQTKKSVAQVDISPMILQAEAGMRQLDDNKNLCHTADKPQLCLYMLLTTGSASNLKPELVMDAFARFSGRTFAPYALQIHRLESYADIGTEEQPKLVPLLALGEEIEQAYSDTKERKDNQCPLAGAADCGVECI